MQTARNSVIVLMLATLLTATNASAQTEQASGPAPEPAQAAPATETVPHSIPGILLMPPAPLPSQTQPQTCPFTGQKLELIG
jgi:hypothetical protein